MALLQSLSRARVARMVALVLVGFLASLLVRRWAARQLHLPEETAWLWYGAPSGILLVLVVELTYRFTPRGRREALLETETLFEDLRLRVDAAIERLSKVQADRAATAPGDPGLTRLDQKTARRLIEVQALERKLSRARSRLRYLAAEVPRAESDLSSVGAAAASAVDRVRRPDSDGPRPSSATVAAGSGEVSSASDVDRARAEHPFVEFGAIEKRSADVFRWVSFVVLFASIAAAIGFIWFVDAEDDAAAVLRKLAPGLPLAVLFGYLARESARHRANELWARRNAILLQALRPFLDDTGDGARDEIRRIFGMSLFQAAPITVDQEPPAYPADPTTAVGEVHGLLAQLQALSGQLSSGGETKLE